jgi:hypothetical protein
LCPEWGIRVPSLSAIFPPTFNLPPVSDVVDGEAVEKALAGRLSSLRPNWDRIKKRLSENRHRPGLDFKRWTKGGPDVYSVRVDDNFRTHLKRVEGGRWLTERIGGHKEMGHG